MKKEVINWFKYEVAHVWNDRLSPSDNINDMEDLLDELMKRANAAEQGLPWSRAPICSGPYHGRTAR